MVFSSLRIVVSFAAILAPLFVHAQEDLSCDIIADVTQGSCTTLNNGVCDRDTDPDCDLDCQDCDFCQDLYDFDCAGCQANGCYWCPLDGTCRNTNRYTGGGLLCERNGVDNDWIKDEPGICTDNVDDPLEAAEEWAYEMVNVRPVWNRGIFGSGIRVRVNDNGVDSDHPEFEGRFDEAGSCGVFEAETGTGTKGGVSFSHGTFVAAIIGAARGNGVCSAGFAPLATISSCSVYEPGTGTTVLGEQLDDFDIANNSYGSDGCSIVNSVRERRRLQACPFDDSIAGNPCASCDFSEANLGTTCESAIQNYCVVNFENDFGGCTDFIDVILQGECNFVTLRSFESTALSNGVTQGRDGKGVIWVFASGNAFGSGDDTNFQGFTTSRFVITVGAVGKDGLHSKFSTPGTGVFIAAPGGDTDEASAHATAGNDGACDDSGAGTSFAAPVVAGVVALMLEANADLTWRDVQEILAETARRVDEDTDDPFAGENAAGFWFSNLYGFGIVDADAAVQAASSWPLISEEIMLTANSGDLNLPIADDENSPTSTSVTIASGRENFVAESVNVQLDLDHFARGHLRVVLTSPQGTQSVLTPGSRPEDNQLSEDSRFKLLTLRNWGENPDGDWTLTITDTREGDVVDDVDRGGAVDQLGQFTLVVYGRQIGDETSAPSSQPSLLPSAGPSVLEVSQEPSNLPSILPSLAPSSGPSESNGDPSAVPSAAPSGEDESSEPSGAPSIVPSSPPSSSEAPSSAEGESSSLPSTEPSSVPSEEPSISFAPSSENLERPTLPFKIDRGNLLAASRPTPAVPPASRPTMPAQATGKGKGKGQQRRRERRQRRQKRGKGSKKSGKGKGSKKGGSSDDSSDNSEDIDEQTEAILRLIASRMTNPEAILSRFSRLIVR